MASKSTENPHHGPDLPRINRIAGQINGVKKMVEEQRACPDILTQLRAIRSAVKGLEASILERQLNHCVAEGLSADDPALVAQKIDELKEMVTRYHD